MSLTTIRRQHTPFALNRKPLRLDISSTYVTDDLPKVSNTHIHGIIELLSLDVHMAEECVHLGINMVMQKTQKHQYNQKKEGESKRSMGRRDLDS